MSSYNYYRNSRPLVAFESDSESEHERLVSTAFQASSEDELSADLSNAKLSVTDAIQKRDNDLASGKAVPVGVTRGVPDHISAAAAHDLQLVKSERKSSQRVQQVPGKEKVGMLVKSNQAQKQRMATPIDVPQSSMSQEQVKSYRNAARLREKYLVDSFKSVGYQAMQQKPLNRRWINNFGGFKHAHTKYDEKEAIEDMLKTLINVKITNDNEVIDTPSQMTIVLKPHQREGVTWMMRNEKDFEKFGGILGDDMGLGKTVQTLALLLAHPPPEDHSSHRTLVVAPTATLEHWKREAETRFKPGTLKVLVYHGPRRHQYAGSITDYDVVVTSLGIVSAEWTHKIDGKTFSFNEAERSIRDQKILQSKDSGPLFSTIWRRIVVDEAHELKNRTAIRSMACCDLVGQYRWCLSGTPIQNSLNDLYSLLRFLRIQPYCEYRKFKKTEDFLPGQVQIMRSVLEHVMLRRRKDMFSQESELRLPRRYYYSHIIDLSPAERIVYNYFAHRSCQNEDWEKSTGIMALLQLLLRMRQTTSHPSVILSGKYPSVSLECGEVVSESLQKYWIQSNDAVRKLPIGNELAAEFCGFCSFRQIDFDKVINVHRCGAFICEECAKHKSAHPCQECLQQLPNGYDIKPLDTHFTSSNFPGDREAGLLKYLKRGNGAFTDRQLISWLEESYMRTDSNSLPSSKMKRILAILQSINQHNKTDKTVVFTEHLHIVALLSDYLARSGFPNLKYTGAMNRPSREKALEDFSTNPETRVLIVSKKAGAIGINLAAANHIIIESLWWNPAIDNQAIDRVYRIGQTKQVHVHILIARSTVDEKIFEVQNEKRRLIDAVISDNKAAESIKLSREDILRILKSVYNQAS